MKAIYIRTIQGQDVWRIVGRGQSFYTNWTIGHTKQQIEDYYND